MNQTSVGIGAVAGAIMIIVWWAIGQITEVEATAEVVAASCTLATALMQFFIPYRHTKRTRKTDA